MISNKPEEELEGRCDLMFCSIQFKVTEMEQIGDHLCYDHAKKRIKLRRCAHVKYLEDNTIALHMQNNVVITMRVPYPWLNLLPQWVAYLRQVPLWQITPMKTLSPQSWAKKKVSGFQNKWDVVYLRYRPTCGILDYYGDEALREDPLGSLAVEATHRTETTLTMGKWIFRFETVLLCRAWQKTLVPGKHKRRQSIGGLWE